MAASTTLFDATVKVLKRLTLMSERRGGLVDAS
jgi:hypothetical protein